MVSKQALGKSLHAREILGDRVGWWTKTRARVLHRTEGMAAKGFTAEDVRQTVALCDEMIVFYTDLEADFR